MEDDDLAALLRNAIRDDKVIMDNPDYFLQQRQEGFFKDHTSAENFIDSLHSYCQQDDKQALLIARERLAGYYKPFVETFTGTTPNIKKAKRVGKNFGIATIIGLAVSIFVPGFVYCVIPVGIISVSALGYGRNLAHHRQGFLQQFNKLDSEAETITVPQLEKILKENRPDIMERLSKNYSYEKT